ncbi:MAG TPA: YtxH domain-containing protein [Hanamia sp.]|nr:YtxH domain-containing protein [Hanamia sp.]
MNSSKKILITLAAGMALGFAGGIFTAPQSGYRTRRNLKRKGEKFSSDVRDMVSDVNDKISDNREKLMELKEGLVKEVKKKVEQFS